MIFKDLKIGDYFVYYTGGSIYQKISSEAKSVNCLNVQDSYAWQYAEHSKKEIIKCDKDGNEIVGYLTIDEIPAGSYFKDDHNTLCYKPFKTECTIGYSNIAIVISGYGYSGYTLIKVTSARIFLIVDESEIKE